MCTHNSKLKYLKISEGRSHKTVHYYIYSGYFIYLFISESNQRNNSHKADAATQVLIPFPHCALMKTVETTFMMRSLELPLGMYLSNINNINKVAFTLGVFRLNFHSVIFSLHTDI